MVRLEIPALLLSFGLVACGGGEEPAPAPAPAEPAAEEKAEPAKAEAKPAALPEGAVVVKVDAEASTFGFVGAKVTGSHDGGFDKFEGQIAMVDGALHSTEFVIDLTSVHSDNPKLTKHLKAPDFFDVGQFAKAQFKSTEIKKEEKGERLLVTGMLDFHGIEKELSFPVKMQEQPEGIKVDAEFTMDRQLWGVSYAGKKDNLIKDEVVIKLDLSFPRQADAEKKSAKAEEGKAGGKSGGKAAKAAKAN